MGLTSPLSDAYDTFSSCFYFFFALESDEDISDESDNEGSGSRFTSGSCTLSFFSEKSVGSVSSPGSVGHGGISKSVGRVSGIFSVGRVS